MTIATNAIVTLNESKDYLKDTSGKFDAIIQQSINGLSTIFETKSGRKIKKRTLTDYRVDGNGEWRLTLPWAPVQSVAKVELRYDRDDSVYKTITDSSKWILKSKEQGLLQLIEDVFLCGRQNVLITHDVGWNDADDKMLSIKDKFLAQLKFNYDRWVHDENGTQTKTFLDGSIGFIPRGPLLPEVEDFLKDLNDVRVI